MSIFFKSWEQQQIERLEAENEELKKLNQEQADAILELADIIENEVMGNG